MEFTKVGTEQFVTLAAGTLLWFALPVAVALIWKIRKKEPLGTMLIGAATFLVFALIFEKPVQNLLIFPAQMGLEEHAASRFINARPVLLGVLLGLFPGVFEETGRLVAFKTVLRKRQNKETSISHGIGHGGFEVILSMGVTYITYIVYAFMINSGGLQELVDLVTAQAPDQAAQVYALASQIASFSAADLVMPLVERIFAFMFHVGASILVFYACRDRKRFWLYPLAILIHTIIDCAAGLSISGAIGISAWEIEGVVILFGSFTFFGAYFLLYKKDSGMKGSSPEKL